MKRNGKTSNGLMNTRIDIKFKLSGLWLVFMMLYIYTDFYTLFEPGSLQEMLSGFKDGVLVTQVFLLVSAVVTIIPAFMIVLCLVVNARISRWMNIIIGIFHLAIGVVNLIGASWGYYIFYGVSLTLISILIVALGWKWPKNENAERVMTI